jgi:hypothetical protein
MDFERSRLIKWECLSRYFQEKRGIKLDSIFGNPLCEDTARLKILDKLEINNKQKEFLLNVFDIDYLYVPRTGKPSLVEEKSKDINGTKFQSGNFIYLHHGTSTQHKNLQDAHTIGIEAGILLRCIKYKRKPQGLLGYVLPSSENIACEESKFYPIKDCEYLPQTNQSKIKVDKFISRMRRL